MKLSLKDASRLTGQLFLQKSAVNLLSTVLDVPEFFWDAADELQGLYGTVTKYLELKNRVAVLNARYEVLESMLLMVQQQLQNDHGSRLEWIIIWCDADEGRAAPEMGSSRLSGGMALCLTSDQFSCLWCCVT